MKKSIKYIALSAIAALAAACAPEYPELVEAQLPQASDLNVTVTVDQSTNYATFSISNKDLVPVWIFGSELIDGKANKNYSYVGNGITLRFREAGDHSVEVKAYNKAGLSTGSKVVTFTMNEAYYDPFDAAPYVKAISNGSSQNWVWNSTEKGHFGCGPVGDPLGWWPCDANGKAGFLYDDVMTFSSEGKYTFNPGDGKAYANTGSEYMSEYNTGEDYLFPVETMTTDYHFENSWNDAGIEEIYLCLESGSILSYVPHKSAVEEPRFQVLETKTSSMKKKLQLMCTVYTPNNEDGISWYYEFVPEGSVAGAEDPLYGADSKTWVLDNSVKGYMGCGPDAGNPTGWWSANPNEKDAYGVTDDELTFFKDGKYVFNPGADGLVYCNWESGYLPDGNNYSGDGSTDYDAPASEQVSTYTLGSDATGDYIELPAGILFSYVPRPEVFTASTRLYIKELTEDRLVLVPYFQGIIAWQLIFKPKGGGASGGDSYTYGEELLTGEPALDTWFSPSNWSGGLDPQASFSGGTLTLTVPDGVGGAEWQGQVKLSYAIPADPAKQYSFSCNIDSSEEGTATVKLADANDDSNHAFFYDPNVEIDGETAYKNEPVSPDQAYTDVMVIFDFGRMPAGTNITVTDLSLKEITGGAPSTPDTPDTPDTPGTSEDEIDETGVNLWTDASVSLDTWFSPSNWSGGLTPQIIFPLDGNGFTLVVPQGVGGSEWQGQVKLLSDIPTEGEFNVAARIHSTRDGKATFKMTSNSDPDGNEFFYDGSVELKANQTVVSQKKGVSMDAPGETILLVFDFGRMPAGTVITVTDIGVRDLNAVSYGDELWNGTETLETWFSPGDWSGGLDPGAQYSGGTVTLTVPDGVGGSEWQGQVKLHSKIPIDASKKYSFSARIEAGNEGTATVKLTSNTDPGGLEFFYDNNVKIEDEIVYSREPVSMAVTSADETIMIVFDFGRFPAGTAIKISDISIRESI